MSPRYILRLLSAFFSRFGSVVLIGVVIGLTVFVVVNFLAPRMFTHTQRIGLVGRYQSDNLPEGVVNYIAEGLTQVDAEQNLVPALATHWEAKDDGKTWTFYLDETKYWQDGEKVKSTDIKYEFTDVVTEYPDDKTIVFKLTSAFSAFPTTVSKPVFKKGLLGTGDYTVEKIRLTSTFVQEMILKNVERQKMVFRFYPTEEAAKIAFKLGKIDQLVEIIDPSPFSDWSTTQTQAIVDEEKIVLLFFNTQDKYVADKSLRQTLAYLIDKDGMGKRAVSPIIPTSWAYNPAVKRYDVSVDRAQELYDSLPDEVTTDLKLSLATSPALLSFAENIKTSWEDFGIPTSVQVVSGIPEDFQIYLALFEPPKDPDQYALWHSTQVGSNISRYSSPRIDKLLEDGRSFLDQDQRRSIYLDFQRYLLEDVPAAFLFHPTFYTITRR